MIGSVVHSDIIFQHLIKLLKGMDFSGVDGVDPRGFHTEPLPLRFSFAGSIPYFGVDKADAKGNTDHGELLVGIGPTIIDQKFGGNTAVGGNGIL